MSGMLRPTYGNVITGVGWAKKRSNAPNMIPADTARAPKTGKRNRSRIFQNNDYFTAPPFLPVNVMQVKPAARRVTVK